MGIARRYIKKIHEETTFYAMWSPSQVVDLGDYGPLNDDGVFRRVGNVTDPTIGFASIDRGVIPRPADFLDIETEEGTSITVKAEGATLPGSKLPDAKAGLVVSLSQSNALVCKLKGAEQEQIQNFRALQDFIVDLYGRGKWTKDWRIVSERVIADGTTIVYSDTRNVDVEATAEAPITDIADASVQFSVVYKRGGQVSIVGGPGLSPFVSLVRLHTPLFGSPSVSSFTAEMVRAGDVSPTLMIEVPR